MKQTIFISLLFSLIFVILNQFFSWGDWYFMVYSLLPGFFIPFFQKREKSLQIVPAIIVGSVIYSLVSMLSVESLLVLREGTQIHWSEISQASLIFAVMSFIGGLIGIVFKGLGALQNKA